MMLTDKQFYKAALDLSIPEMKEARDLFFAGKRPRPRRFLPLMSDPTLVMKPIFRFLR
jgi:hypothetical protein